MEICCFPQSISTYFYKFQSISIILSPYRPYLLIPFLTLLIYSLNGYKKRYFPLCELLRLCGKRLPERLRTNICFLI
ncbi:MAG: hypothetical protein AB1422_07585 [bacterium]